MDRKILYVFEHKIKDVCKIGIGTVDRAKKAYQYLNDDQTAKRNKLAIFVFEGVEPLVIETICKQVLKRINSTEFYIIEFYKACTLFTLIGGKLDTNNSQYIDRNKICITIAQKTEKNSVPLSQRFADLIKLLISKDEITISKVKDELNNNGKRNVLLSKAEFSIYNSKGNRTGWKSYNDEWYYRTGVDATAMSKYIKIIEQTIL